MDRYIVQNNVTGLTMADQIDPKPTQTYIIQPGTSKLMEATECDQDYTTVHEDVPKMESEAQFTAKALDTSQFNEGVGNTTYIIDNNSSNSIDSVRIGNQSFVPVVDSSQLYNISVAGSSGQYTIEGVVNPGLGNYIIEGPAYIVEAKTAQPHTMYIQEAMPALQPLHVPQEPQQMEVEKKGKKKKPKQAEVGPFICQVCNQEFTSSASLRFHSYHHNPKSRRFTCIGCDRAFEKDKEKEEHELQCELNFSGNKFSCLFCDLPFSTPKNLRTHENKHRPTKKTKKYKHMCVCIKCNKAFDAIYTLKVHIKKIHGGNAATEKKKKKKLKTETETIDSQQIAEEQKQINSVEDIAKIEHVEVVKEGPHNGGHFLVLS